jgi:ribonuclease HI
MVKSPEVTAHIDGASRGNPGPAAYAVVMKSADGSRLTSFSRYLGEATNNVAEYQALLAALEYALKNHYLRLHVQTDSELLAYQIEGVYKVNNPGLKLLQAQARQMIARLESFSIQHVPRELNYEADRLANQALDAAERGHKRHQAVGSPPHAPLPSRRGESGVGERPPVPPPHGPLPSRGGESGAGEAAQPLRTSATFHKGVLEPHGQLSLFEGEVVNLEIYRKE